LGSYSYINASPVIGSPAFWVACVAGLFGGLLIMTSDPNWRNGK